MEKTKNRAPVDIPVIYIIITALCLVLCTGILLGVYLLKPAAVSAVNAGNAAWNRSSELRTGESLKVGVDDREGFLTVPVPEGTSVEDIRVESDYKEHMVRLMIPGVSEGFFGEHFFSGDLNNIDTFRYGFKTDGAVVELLSSGFYETELEIKGDKLFVALIPPHEKYDRIVVVDASHGGEDTGSVSYGVSEKDIALNVSLALERASEGRDFHIYLTRTSDETVSAEQRNSLAEDTQADLFIGLHTDADPDTRVTHGISAYYYEDTVKELADAIAEAVSDSTANDFKEASRRSSGRTVQNTDIKEVDLCLGYITNKRDALTAASDRFAERASEGMIAAIEKHFEGQELVKK